MCWNHIIWCCFHWEKHKIQKKTRHYWKSFTSYLHNGSTLGHNSTWFWKLQSRATTFIFYHFRQLVMWPPSKQPMRWTLMVEIICIFIVFTFWSRRWDFLFRVLSDLMAMLFCLLLINNLVLWPLVKQIQSSRFQPLATQQWDLF